DPGVLGGVAAPLLDFGMAVSKGKAAGAVMIASRDVLPGAGIGVVDEVPVVDRVGMLIDEQPGLGRSRNLGLFQVLSVLRKAPVHSADGRIRSDAKSSKNGIHGKTAIPLREAGIPLSRAEIIIRRAFINAEGGSGIFAQDAGGDPIPVRVADIVG